MGRLVDREVHVGVFGLHLYHTTCELRVDTYGVHLCVLHRDDAVSQLTVLD